MKTLVNMLFGSQLYGTATENSDTDIKAVHIDDLDNYVLQRVTSTISEKREKSFGEKNTKTDTDFESYELNKYVNLLRQGQTVAIDMLFAPPQFWTSTSWEWERLVKYRSLFLSKKAESFVGYCRTQANKYGIKGSRVAAARAATEFFASLVGIYGNNFCLKDCGPLLEKWAQDENNEFIVILPIDEKNKEKMLSVCGRKSQWGNSLKNTYEMYKRIFDEYGARSLEAEKNDGVDWKALSHSVRIAQQAIELFKTGEVIFPRLNAAELLDIKLGKRPFIDVAHEIEDLLLQVEAAAKASSLPADVDNKQIDCLILEMFDESFGR